MKVTNSEKVKNPEASKSVFIQTDNEPLVMNVELWNEPSLLSCCCGAVAVELWFWSCGAVAVELWMHSGDCEVTKLWQCSCGCEDEVPELCLRTCDFAIVFVKLYLWSCDHGAVVPELLLWSCVNGCDCGDVACGAVAEKRWL